jgi:phosphomannomutase/phosphoglucomutase
MITASHNPPEYNGFKIWAGDTTIHGDEVRRIHDIMAGPRETAQAPPGVVGEHDMLPAYLDELAGQARTPAGPVKVVVDGGNGAGGLIAVELLRRAGAEVVPLYCEPDGSFPNHHPDPVVEKYMAELQRAVVEHGAHLGVGLDGDADRIGMVDEQGNMVYGDRLLAVFARDVLREHPGAPVMGEVKCSHLTYRDIENHGGEPIMGVTGHSVMKAAMLENGALLAGEMSGHFFFADRYYGFDDGVYAALRLVELVGQDPSRPVSSWLDDWPRVYNTPELRVDCPERVKFLVVQRARETFAKTHDIIDVDGVRVVFPDGWGLVRASNTQPALVLRFEAETPRRLEEIRRLIEEPIQRWVDEMS